MDADGIFGQEIANLSQDQGQRRGASAIVCRGRKGHFGQSQELAGQFSQCLVESTETTTRSLLAIAATVVAVSFDCVSPPPRQGFASPVLAMLTPLRNVVRGSARPLTRRQKRIVGEVGSDLDSEDEWRLDRLCPLNT